MRTLQLVRRETSICREQRIDSRPSRPCNVRGNPAWDVGRYFGKATAGLSLDETMYGLRHASIVRQLKANVPQTIVAHNHDTSPAMLQRTYARYITTQSDALTRKALIDFE